MQSILGRATSFDIIEKPFPHLVIRDALEPAYYKRLAREFPADEIILDNRQPANNKNYRYAASDAVSDPRICPMWREFVQYHVSRNFLGEVFTLFESHIRELNPDLEKTVGRKLEEWESNVRFQEPKKDIALECQLALGTPVSESSRMIGPHVDREVALFAGLLYLRDDADESRGGDLELYTLDGGMPVFEQGTRCVPDRFVTCFHSIKYDSNTLVFFLQSPYSIHGVTPREVTKFPRRHVNFVGELPFKVFDLSNCATVALENSNDVCRPPY